MTITYEDPMPSATGQKRIAITAAADHSKPAHKWEQWADELAAEHPDYLVTVVDADGRVTERRPTA